MSEQGTGTRKSQPALLLKAQVDVVKMGWQVWEVDCTKAAWLQKTKQTQQKVELSADLLAKRATRNVALKKKSPCWKKARMEQGKDRRFPGQPQQCHL